MFDFSIVCYTISSVFINIFEPFFFIYVIWNEIKSYVNLLLKFCVNIFIIRILGINRQIIFISICIIIEININNGKYSNGITSLHFI